MRNVSINLTEILPVYECGNCGEHNATQININIQSYFTDDVDFYVLVFRNQYNETICSDKYEASDITNGCITIKLPGKLTKTTKEQLVVEAYKYENEDIKLLAKSPVFNLVFEGSISSDEAIEIDKYTFGLYKHLLDLEEEFNGNIDIMIRANETSAEVIAQAAQATILADNAADLATNSATNANNAATNANNAATNANNARDNANSIGELLTQKLNNGDFIGPPGTTNYTELENKPSINGTIIEGELHSDNLSIVPDLEINGNQIRKNNDGQIVLYFNNAKSNSGEIAPFQIESLGDGHYTVCIPIPKYTDDLIDDETYFHKDDALYLNPLLQVNSFFLGRATASGQYVATESTPRTIGNEKLYYFDFDVTIHVKDGYTFEICTYSNSTGNRASYIDKIKQKSSDDFIVPANTYFRFFLYKADGSNFESADDVQQVRHLIFADTGYLDIIISKIERKFDNVINESIAVIDEINEIIGEEAEENES